MAVKATRDAPKTAKGKGKAPQRAPRPRARSPSSSGSDAESSSNGDGQDDQAAMLAALQAHSRSLFGLDGPNEAGSSTQAQQRSDVSDDDDDGEDEFEQSDDGWGAEDDFVTDSEAEELEAAQPKSTTKPGPAVPEVVFAPQMRSEVDVLSKAERKAFLLGNSAKMMGIKREDEYAVSRKRPRDEAEEADDHSKLKLDKTLHEMLLNNLLPSAAAAEAQRPVDKRNAMHGRLLELANYALPGEGSKTASSTNANLSSYPAKIRTGIIHAQAKREAAARKEAELAGNKGLGENPRNKHRGADGKRDRAMLGADLSKKKGMENRKKGDAARDRGLGMGIGKFDKGMLRLSEREIARGSGERRGGGGGRGGRGGRGGKGGKRGKR